MSHDTERGGPLLGVRFEHALDEIFGIMSIVPKDFEELEVVFSFADVGLAHIPITKVKGVMALGEDIEKDQTKGEDVDRSGNTTHVDTMRISSHNSGTCTGSTVHAGTRVGKGHHGTRSRASIVVKQQFRGTPAGSTSSVGGSGAERRLSAFQLLTETKV